ncbi:MAG: class I SAM-dependent methyltransferase [Streptomycetaceae bacterium]|nr:class I SAM-dependent methyltransferase [Streptomycetaceae bacterium]
MIDTLPGTRPRNIVATGDRVAPFPHTTALARALTRPLREDEPPRGRGRPRRILEAGPGAGTVTRRIAAAMRPGDTLDLVEASPRAARLMDYQLVSDAELSRIRTRTRVHTGRVQDIDLDEAAYTTVICGIPLTDLTPADAEAVLEQLFAALRPDGRLTFAVPLRNFAGRTRRVRRIIDGFTTRYGIARRLVAGNLPPVHVHALAATPKLR